VRMVLTSFRYAQNIHHMMPIFMHRLKSASSPLIHLVPGELTATSADLAEHEV
jgi:hypothetical protein